jgi:hypothetical protein
MKPHVLCLAMVLHIHAHVLQAILELTASYVRKKRKFKIKMQNKIYHTLIFNLKDNACYNNPCLNDATCQSVGTSV